MEVYDRNYEKKDGLMSAIIVRTTLLYVLTTVLFRLMGKRQVGELEMSELITTLLLSEIATLPIDDPNIPLLYAVIPILLLVCFEILITFAKTRCNLLKRVFESEPIVLIRRGELCEKELSRMRITVDELISECRLQGIGSTEDVEYAILEQNGKLSVIPKSSKSSITPSDVGIKTEERGIMHPLIVDGSYHKEGIKLAGLDREAVDRLCIKRNLSPKAILLLGIDDGGHVTLVKKEVAQG